MCITRNLPMRRWPAVAADLSTFCTGTLGAGKNAISAQLNGRKSGGYGGERRYVLDRFGINPKILIPQFSNYMNYFSVSV